MSDRTYTTKTGRVLTSLDFEALADEAEAGYDVDEMLKNRADALSASLPPKPEIVRVRVPGDLLAAVERLAEAQETSVNELILLALRQLVVANPRAAGGDSGG